MTAVGALSSIRRALLARAGGRPSAAGGDAFDHVPALAADIPRYLRRSRRWPAHRQLAKARPYLDDAEHAGTADFAALAARLAAALDAIEDRDLHRVPLEDRVRAWLAAEVRRDELADFVVGRRFQAGNVATHLAGDRLLADFGDLHPAGIPDRLIELRPEETRLELRIRRCRPTADGVALELFALVRALDHDSLPVEYVLSRGGEGIGFTRPTDPAATRFAARWYQQHDSAALHLTLPDLARDLTVDLTAGSFRRTATLTMGRVRARMPQQPPAGRRVLTGVRIDGSRLMLDGPGVAAPLTAAPFGLSERPVPPGQVELPEGLAPSAELVGRLPLELTGPAHRVEVTLPDGELRITLHPPLHDDERGPRRQQLLRERHAAQAQPLDPGLVLFTSFAGAAVTDSPAAIYAELRRRRPDLRLVWAVADHSVVAPEGAETVLVRSRRWFDAWSTAQLIVTNIEPDRFFRIRPGQQLLQTCHGYPSKAMGKVQWRAKNFSPRQIGQQLLETSGNWTLLLTPDPSMDRHYREQYDWAGPILHEGYPRDDALLASTAEETRTAVRGRLGIPDDATAVLYAPTWRDHLASDFRVAEMVDHLDLELLLDRLGPDAVVLLRGHRFNSGPASGDRVLDVTAYPEINDLILASDAAVLDYSSLRFDYALTGKPMVFLVPDLEDYAHGGRGFLFPFEESAPGPLVRDTAGVAAELADLDGLRRRYRDPIDAFNRRFQPRNDGRAAERVVDALLARLPR